LSYSQAVTQLHFINLFWTAQAQAILVLQIFLGRSFRSVEPSSTGMVYCCKLLVERRRPFLIELPWNYLALSNLSPEEIGGSSLFVTRLGCLLRLSGGVWFGSILKFSRYLFHHYLGPRRINLLGNASLTCYYSQAQKGEKPNVVKDPRYVYTSATRAISSSAWKIPFHFPQTTLLYSFQSKAWQM
jgi:hypothetical protein